MSISIKNKMMAIDFLSYHLVIAFTFLRRGYLKKWTVKKGFYVNTYKVYPFEISIYY